MSDLMRYTSRVTQLHRSSRSATYVIALVIFAIAAFITACASIMGVDDPVLATANTADGAVLPEDDDASNLEEAGDGQAACSGEGCACSQDQDCDPTTSYTHCVNHACVECTTAGGGSTDSCPAGHFCLPGTGAGTPDGGNAFNECAPGCSSDDSCKSIVSAPFCNLTRHQCVACQSDADCKIANQGCSPSGVCADLCKEAGGSCPAGLTCCNQYCLDTTKDVLNCNGCGLACGGSDLCCGSACKNPITDVANCGGCGDACSTTNGTPSCSAGSCKWSCALGFSHCGTTNSGCETATNTTTQCGGCTTDCTKTIKNATGPSCALQNNSYQCTYAACNADFIDCDGVRSDGCDCHCGNHNEVCCANNACTATNQICVKVGRSGDFCEDCGGSNQFCCSGNKCGSGLTCSNEVCRTPCGGGNSGCDHNSDCCSNNCDRGRCK